MNHGNADYWVMKLDNGGNLQWEKSYGGRNEDDAYDVEQTNDGGYILAGATGSNDGDVTGNHITENGTSYDYWIVKTDGSGNIQWEKCYGGSGGDMANCIRQTTDGGYIVSGTSTSNDGDVTTNPNGGAWIIKLDAAGTIQWQRGDENNGASYLLQTTDGGYVYGSNSSLVKIDAMGNAQWQEQLVDTNYNGYAYSIQQTSDGWFILAGMGQADSFDSLATGSHGSEEFWIEKLGPPVSIIASLQTQNLSTLLCSPFESDTVYVHNSGHLPLVISSATLSDSNNFLLIAPVALPVTIAPGDSSAFVVQFGPNTAGNYSSTLSLISNDSAAGHNPWMIQFTGTKENLSFTTNNSEINFGTVAINGTKDSMLTVYNTGTTTETIQIFVSPPFYASKSFVTLGAGDSAVIGVHYSSMRFDTNTATICFVISSPSPCYDLSCVIARGTTPASNESQIAADSLNAGTLTCQSSEDTSVYIQAVGASSLTIDSVVITGADANAFQPAGNSFPLTVNPGLPGTPVYLRFVPQHTGISTATMLVYSSNATNSPFVIPLTGAKAAVGITINNQTINFGAVALNSLKDSVLEIRNIGTTAETVNMQVNAPFSLDEISVTIAPGDSITVTIHFTRNNWVIIRIRFLSRRVCRALIRRTSYYRVRRRSHPTDRARYMSASPRSPQ